MNSKNIILLASVSLLGMSAMPALAADNAANGDVIVVTAARQEKTARKEQQLAPNLINVQSAEAIAKYPDYNAAEALSRIPGVTLSIDTGEGRFVNIRGIDGNLNGATFGGTVLLNTNAFGVSFNNTGRAVEFDTIPVGSIDRISVIKSFLPEHDAEGIGGSVELTPRSALGHDKLFLEGTLGEGYEPKRKTTNLNEEIVIGGAFGTNANGGKLVHVVLTQNEHNDGRGFDDFEPSYLDSPGVLGGISPEDRVLSSIDFRRYRYHRERYGYSFATEITPDSNNRVFLRANLAGYQERVYRQIVTLSNLGNQDCQNPDPTTGSCSTSINGTPITPVPFGTLSFSATNPNAFTVTAASAKNTLRDEKESHRNLALQLGGEHHFGKLKFDWIAAYERAVYDKPFDYFSTFSGPQDSITLTYDNVTNANRPTISGASVNFADPAIYNLSKIANSNEYTADREYSYGANLSYPVGLTPNDEFKIGGKLRYRQKFDLTGGSSLKTGLGQPLSQFIFDGPFSNYYNGLFNVGYAANGPQIVSTFGPQVAIGPLSKTDTGTLLFNDTENIVAGFAQYSGTFDKLGVNLGVRVERTKTILGGFSSKLPAPVPVDANGNYLTFVTKTYTNVFPTVQLRYQATPKFVARAAYSTSVSRPGFNQTAQNANVSNLDPNSLSVTIGNPDLKPTYSNNFDLSFEYYLSHSGIISIGFFDKEIRNFVATSSTTGVPGNTAAFETYNGSAGSVTGLYRHNSYANTTGTYDRGIEASFVDKFDSLPGALSGFGVDLNAVYNKSRVNLHNGQPAQPIPGTAEFSGNAAVFYELHSLRLRLAAKYDGKTVFTVGGGPNQFSYANIPTDAYLDRRITLDFTGGFDFNKNVAFYGSVKNITNAALRYYEGYPNRPTQREYYGQTYEAGIKVKL